MLSVKTPLTNSHGWRRFRGGVKAFFSGRSYSDRMMNRADNATGTRAVRSRAGRVGATGKWLSRLLTFRSLTRSVAGGNSPLSSEIADGLSRQEFFLVYQPKINLRRREIVSIEALIRWRHPQRGLVPPMEFIPQAENTNDIVRLSEWVTDRAIRDQRSLAEDGHDLTVFVNIAAALLTNAEFMGSLTNTIVSSGARIGIEITETSVIRDPEVAIRNLQRVSGAGIPVAIDDYGAGLSSLAYLKQLPAKELKIDKLFITQLTSTQRDPLIVRSTIDLAHAMEMDVVAEGIENETALALLTVMGCDIAQGYHISAPLEFCELQSFLAEHAEGWRSGVEGAAMNGNGLFVKRR